MTSIVLAFMCILFVNVRVTHSQDDVLSVVPRSDLSAERRSLLEAFEARPNVRRALVMSIDADRVGTATAIELPSTFGHVPGLQRTSVPPSLRLDAMWKVGERTSETFGIVGFAFETMFGFIRRASLPLLIYPLGDYQLLAIEMTSPTVTWDAVECDWMGDVVTGDNVVLASSGETSCCTTTVLVVVSSCAADAMAADGQSSSDVAEALVAAANEAYAASNIVPRLKLVHTHETQLGNCDPASDMWSDMYYFAECTIDYFLSGETRPFEDVCTCDVIVNGDLERLQTNGDIFADEIHALRNLHAADLVVLITDFQMCPGLACDVLATSETAFTLVPYPIIGGTLHSDYFIHEVGHLQGAGHDPPPAGLNYSSFSPFSYGHGYRWNNDASGTVMSYADDRHELFSSPLVSPAGGGLAGTEDQNNARVLNETACRMAMIRTEATVSPSMAGVLVRPANSVEITVTVTRDGAPVPNARVIEESDDPTVAIAAVDLTTDVSGEAKLVIAGISAGSATITVRSEGGTAEVRAIVSSTIIP